MEKLSKSGVEKWTDRPALIKYVSIHSDQGCSPGNCGESLGGVPCFVRFFVSRAQLIPSLWKVKVFGEIYAKIECTFKFLSKFVTR